MRQDALFSVRISIVRQQFKTSPKIFWDIQIKRLGRKWWDLYGARTRRRWWRVCLKLLVNSLMTGKKLLPVKYTERWLFVALAAECLELLLRIDTVRYISYRPSLMSAAAQLQHTKPIIHLGNTRCRLVQSERMVTCGTLPTRSHTANEMLSIIYYTERNYRKERGKNLYKLSFHKTILN